MASPARSLFTLFTLPATAVLLAAATLGAAAGDDAAVRPERTIRLFDGRSLDGLYTWLAGSGREDPLRVFSVVDEVDGAPAIRVSGERWGGLVTRDAYATTAWSSSSAGASPPGPSGVPPPATAACSSTARGLTAAPGRAAAARGCARSRRR